MSLSMTMAANNILRNSRGTAMVETLPLLIIFTVLLGFGLGLFGVVHTGIMNSMSARTYAFETFSNRSEVTLFRDRKAEGNFYHHAFMENRFHAVDSELNRDNSLGDGIFATSRDIVFGRRKPASEANASDHNTKIYNIPGRNRKEGGVGASPAWVMVGYGICINARCGD